VADAFRRSCRGPIATHSPIILAYPEATIYHCGERGLEPVNCGDMLVRQPTERG
jgi:predicted ATPase